MRYLSHLSCLPLSWIGVQINYRKISEFSSTFRLDKVESSMLIELLNSYSRNNSRSITVLIIHPTGKSTWNLLVKICPKNISTKGKSLEIPCMCKPTFVSKSEKLTRQWKYRLNCTAICQPSTNVTYFVKANTNILIISFITYSDPISAAPRWITFIFY